MKRLTDIQKRRIKSYLYYGFTRKQISGICGIPEGTIAHYQCPRKKNTVKAPQSEITPIFSFTKEDLKEHNIKVGEKAYRKAAVCTVNKLMCLSEMPIQKAIKEICEYQIYLINEYNLQGAGNNRVK
jgi:hypothetical protein